MVKIKRKQKHGFGSFGKENISLLEGVIISSFFPEAEDMTIKEIIERIDYSYERVNTALKSLVKKGIVKEKKVGKTLVYFLDLHNLYAEIGFNHYMLEREIELIKKHPKIFKVIKELEKQPFEMIILFGSYSKGNETKHSDVDLMIITDKKNKENEIYGLKHLYNLDFAPVFVKWQEFPKIKKENPELWNSLKKFSIVFRGDDLYYYWMYKDEKN